MRKNGKVSSYEELYKSVENMCIHKMSENLYKRLEEECEKHISGLLQGLTNRTMGHPAFLELVESAWQDHQSNMITIRSISQNLNMTVICVPTISISHGGGTIG